MNASGARSFKLNRDLSSQYDIVNRATFRLYLTRMCIGARRWTTSFLFFFQVIIASDRITAPRRLVETGPSVARSRTATSARVHLASRVQIARTTSTSVRGTRADMVPATIFTDLTGKSDDMFNGCSATLCTYFYRASEMIT